MWAGVTLQGESVNESDGDGVGVGREVHGSSVVTGFTSGEYSPPISVTCFGDRW